MCVTHRPALPLSLSRGPDLTGNSQPQLLANSRTERITPTIERVIITDFIQLK